MIIVVAQALPGGNGRLMQGPPQALEGGPLAGSVTGEVGWALETYLGYKSAQSDDKFIPGLYIGST
jgi:hypothetical protein